MKYILPLLAFILVILSFNREIRRPESSGEEGARSGALAALDFWTRSRSFPDRDIPADKYYRAYMSSVSRLKDNSRFVMAGTTWEPIGPTNLAGRSLSVALNPQNPNTVYLGTASGGLWRSYTGGLGADWQQVRLGYPALGISSILIDPADSNTIYLGTGEVYNYQAAFGGVVIRTTRGSYGIGILKTTDGGTSWTKSLDWSYNQQRGIQKLAFNPLNPRTIWAATTEGLYKTTNAGLTWGANIPWLLMVMDVVVSPQDSNKVMLSYGNFTNSSALFATTDNGSNWNILPLGGYTGKTVLDVYEAHPNVVYASACDSVTGVGALWRSTDFGTSWVELSDQSTNNIFGVQGWYSHYVAVHPTDSNQVVHAGVDISKSVNGGVVFNFSPGSYSDHHGFAVHPTNRNILYDVNDDGIYRSTNFGATFTNVSAGLQTGQIYNGFSTSTTDSLFLIGQSQDHIPGYRYTGGINWGRSAVDESGWTAIDPTNDNIVYAVNRYGGALYKSTDRGIGFSFSGGFGGIGAWNSPVVIAPSNPAVVYFADTRVWKTTNAGAGWNVTNGGSVLDNNTILSMAVAPTGQDTVYVGTAPTVNNAHVFRTTNGGTTWTDVTGSLPNRYPMDIAVDPTNAKVAYLAFGGFGGGHLFKTTDAGATWADVSGILPDAPATAIAIDPLHHNNVYVGNDIGVYVSTDAGGSWLGYSTGLPDAIIAADLVVSPSNRSIRVATHGNGVWERKLYGEFTLLSFDYKPSILVYPANGAIVSGGSPVTGIRASFINAGLTAPSDSFTVKYRILKGTTEYFTSVKRIPSLGSSETRQVTFPDNFTPVDTGYYTLQAIVSAGDMDASNDTLVGTLRVVPPPSILNYVVTKTGKVYQEIVGGLAGPFGDDSQLRIRLPFTFHFDDFDYDSLQFSTNGWAEFGTGPAGSERGLSTPNQLGPIGANENGRMGTSLRPGKALGVWWEDLSTGFNAPTGSVSYTTLGAAPNRVFIIQWKNILAYYDENTVTTRINFQLFLYETTNVIEFCYGPVVVGSFSGSDVGAMIGMKDYLGGDYRYNDFIKHGSGLASDVTTSLTPLADWPGPDSCYRAVPGKMVATTPHQSRWNLVSVPLLQDDYHIATLYPTAVPGSAVLFNGSYQPADTLPPGNGVWIRFLSAGSQQFNGDLIPLPVNVAVQAGWNIIGGVSKSVPVPTGGLVTSRVFGYNQGYQTVTTLEPGQAYWVKTSGSGTLPIGSVNTPRVAHDAQTEQNSLTIIDRLGRRQTLYLADNSDNRVDLSKYEMPPLPPAGMFDARFVSQRTLETFGVKDRSQLNFPVVLQAAEYPLTIQYSIKNSAGNTISLQIAGGVPESKKHDLEGTGSFVIPSGNDASLAVTISSGRRVPVTYSLHQNYPNPFNPATTIGFDIPSRSRVSLVIYDILGRQVRVLADGEYEAGSYSIRADFSGEASGVYLYRIQAGSYSETRKLVVAK